MARQRSGKAQPRKILNLPWYWWIIIPVALVILFDLSLRLGIKYYAFAALGVFDADTTFRNASYGFDGSMRVHDVSIVPYQGDGSEEPISIRQVELKTPGFFWVVRNALPSLSVRLFKSKRANRAFERMTADEGGDDFAHPPADRMALHLQGVNFGDYGMHYVSADTNWFGSYSGALFEAEGCDAWWWNVSELEGNLGLDTGERNITISYETLGEKTLRQRLDFGGPTMSELRIEVDYELDGPANQFIDQFGEDWRMRKLSWTVSDHGFIAKRNAWCAKAAGISEEEFIHRHLAAVARFLQLDGMIANPEALAVYEKYAREGGELVWETATASAGEVGGSQAQTLAGFIAASGSTLRHGETVAYAMPTAIAPRDWPNGEFDSVWDIVVHEGGGAMATSPAPETAAANAAAADGTAAPAPAPVETPATAAAEPDIAASTDAPPAVAAAPPGSALLDANYRAAPAPRRRAERERLEYDRLELRQRVLVTLAGNRELRGEVEAIDAKEMVLRVRMGGGYARMTLARTRIEKITAP